jgi:cation transport ATPase
MFMGDTGGDERLVHVERMLTELLERQKLSRFDNVMLLTYPVVISGLLIIVSVLGNLDVFKEQPFFGFRVDEWFQTLLIPFLMIVFGLFTYVRSYLRDNLRGRSDSCLLMFIGITWCFIQICNVVFSTYLIALGQSYGLWSVRLGVVIAMLSMFFASVFLSVFVNLKAFDLVRSWFQTNIPQKVRIEGFVTVRTHKLRSLLSLRIGIIALCVASVGYAMVIGIAIRIEGLQTTILYHLICLIAFMFLFVGLIIIERQQSISADNST